MKCTKCGLREARTEIMQRHNNNIERIYLCDECAKNFKPDTKGFDDFGLLDKIINGSPMGLVTGLSELFGTPTPRTLICPDCKTTSEEFLKTGYVGCPRCYEAFEPLVLQTVKKLQQSDRHVGKSPIGAAVQDEETQLRNALIQAAECGDYARVGELNRRLEQVRRDRNGGV